MNREPEANTEANTDELLAWLLQAPRANASTPSSGPAVSLDKHETIGSHASQVTQQANPENSQTSRDRTSPDEDLWWGDPLELVAAEIDIFTPDSSGSALRPLEYKPLEIGEIPAVKDRFQAVLKRRIKSEIAGRLPLFPWETEVCEYYDEFGDSTLSEGVPGLPWTAQLLYLNLPVPVKLPESILAQLLDQCQPIARSGLKEGAKLVRATEALFPNHLQTLNELAGMVLLEYRFNQWGQLESTHRGPVDQKNFPSSYETATPTQQMQLSLLAARQILNGLTLSLNLSGPVVSREWLTRAGKLIVEANYYIRDAVSWLEIQAQMPSAGRLKLTGEQTEAIAIGENPGSLTVQLSGVEPDRTYPLVVEFPTEFTTPLIFAVCPTA